MSHRKIIGSLLGLAGAGFIIAVLIMLPCDPQRNYVCEGRFSETVGQPLGMFSVALLIVFLTLFFLSRVYFAAWGKYAAWFIAVAVVWIATTPAQCSSGFGLSMCMDKELVTWWASGIFLVISFITIIWTRIKLGRAR